METGITCSLCAVYEHDMDVMFMQAMLTDPAFLALFINETEWSGKELKPIHAELSNIELDLGETDITVILTDGTAKYALLIEDKIDAVAQPEQHKRYIKRGDMAVQRGDYADYTVFIVCPQKYYDSNDEAKKYEHFLSYEVCAEYFKNQSDTMSRIRYQEIMQALEKARKPSQVIVREEANTFFKKYCEYQREHYPTLNIRTKETSNGYWVEYATSFPRENIVLVHKMPNGCVDLTFEGKRERLNIMESIAEWLNRHGFQDVCVQTAGKSTVLRIYVPSLRYRVGFDNIPADDIDKCFDSLVKLADIARLMRNVNLFFEKRK